MPEKELLKKICDLVIRSGICPEVMPLQWMRRLLTMHKRRWLYCSVKGSELIAVVGAFRIREWDDRYLDWLPEKEGGNILYIPFIAAEGSVPIAPLRLLRYCLRENPGVREVIYYKKNLNARKQRYVLRKQLPQRRLVPETVCA
jgi:hypothetical protein